jgi:hypothetical protein
MKIPGLLDMRQKKGRESLDNIDKRAGIYGNLLHKAIPLLLFRRVAGESDVSPSGSSGGISVFAALRRNSRLDQRMQSLDRGLAVLDRNK